MDYTWDFFIAHAGPDRDIAERLYELLEGRARTFLDVRSLTLGSDWDIDLAAAQASAQTTVVLISGRTTKAYYQREEIASALALARMPDSTYRVVPIFLDAEGMISADVPYGLRIKHGIVLGPERTIEDAASELLGVVANTTRIDGASRVGIPIRKEPTEEEVGLYAVDPWADNPGAALRALFENQNAATKFSPLFHWKVAVLLARQRRGSEALEALQFGDRLGAVDAPERLLTAGFVYLRTERHQEGEATLRTLIQRRDLANRHASIAYDLLGSELRRQSRVQEAEDRFKTALRLKGGLRDAVGQGITLGNLGRLALYSLRPNEAISYFAQNVAITEKHAPASEGIARNNLAEALVVADLADKAKAVLTPVLSEGRFGARDRGFAFMILAEAALATSDLNTAKLCLESGRGAIEQCSDQDAWFLLEELQGMFALGNGWSITASRRFAQFDEKLDAMGDPLFAIYRWRRRAVLATSMGDEATLTASLANAKTTAIRNGLPSEHIEADLRDLRISAQGLEPLVGSPLWLPYWQSRIPRTLAVGLRETRIEPLELAKLAERVCEFLEAVLESALAVAPDESQRRSFGAKLQRVRTMARDWQQAHEDGQWDVVINAFESIVEIRNRIVHSSQPTSSDSVEGMLGHIQTLLTFMSERVTLTALTSEQQEESLAGLGSVPSGFTRVVVRIDGIAVQLLPNNPIVAGLTSVTL